MAIKRLLDKLNAEVLQIYNEDTGEHGSAVASHINSEEDLVAEALLIMQGMICSFASWRSPNHLVPDLEITAPPTSPVETIELGTTPPVPTTRLDITASPTSPVATIELDATPPVPATRLDIISVTHSGLPAQLPPPPEHHPPSPRITTTPEEEDGVSDSRTTRSRSKKRPRAQQTATKKSSKK